MKSSIVTMVLALFFSFALLNAADTLFVEHFTNGKTDNVWYAGFNAEGNGNVVKPYYLEGNPSGDNWVGLLSTWRPADTGSVGQSYSGSKDLTDFYMEAQVYFPTTGGTPFNFFEFFGIEFRVDSSGNTAGYQFIGTFNPMSVVGPRLRFRKRAIESPAQPVILKQWIGNDIPGGAPASSGWHKLAVNAVGNQFWFYFDGKELPGCPYSDTTSTQLLTSGFIGLYVFHMDFSYPTDTTALLVDDIVVTSPLTAIEPSRQEVISGYKLYQNYPNPFNPETRIEFALPKSENVVLEIYNTLGNKVRTLVNGWVSAGNHQVTWHGVDDAGNPVPGGVYYYHLKAGKFTDTRKMLLVK